MNLVARKAVFNIKETGELSGEMTTTFSGLDYEDREATISESQRDRFKAIQNIYADINNMDRETLYFNQDKGTNTGNNRRYWF